MWARWKTDVYFFFIFVFIFIYFSELCHTTKVRGCIFCHPDKIQKWVPILVLSLGRFRFSDMDPPGSWPTCIRDWDSMRCRLDKCGSKWSWDKSWLLRVSFLDSLDRYLVLFLPIRMPSAPGSFQAEIIHFLRGPLKSSAHLNYMVARLVLYTTSLLEHGQRTQCQRDSGAILSLDSGRSGLQQIHSQCIEH